MRSNFYSSLLSNFRTAWILSKHMLVMKILDHLWRSSFF